MPEDEILDIDYNETEQNVEEKKEAENKKLTSKDLEIPQNKETEKKPDEKLIPRDPEAMAIIEKAL